MTLSRRLARPLLGSIFVTGGLDSFRRPGSKVGPAEPVVGRLQKTPLPLPSDTEAVIRLNGGAQVVAGTLLSLGRLPRLSAAVLAGSLIPTTWAGHRFWEETDPSAKGGQQVHFFKNVAILGGLVLAAVDTEGSPSLGYRARRRAKAARKQARGARKQAQGVAGQARSAAGRLA